MISIDSHPLSRTYSSHILSRSFFITYLCYILVLILPAIILVNIDYSWPNYKRALIAPNVQYKAYQISCLAGTEVIYGSNLDGIDSKDNRIILSAGVEGDQIVVQGIANVAVSACSLNLYFGVSMRRSVEGTGQLPVNFIASQGQNLVSSTQKGSIYLQSSSAIPQSSIPTLVQTSYGSYPSSMLTNFQSSSSNKITLFNQNQYSKTLSSSTATSFTFGLSYKIYGNTLIEEVSLIQKLRNFIPIYMYLAVLLWWVVVSPLVNWMLRNKVYEAKAIMEKIKKD